MNEEAWHDWRDEFERAGKPKRERWLRLRQTLVRPGVVVILICGFFVTLLLVAFALQMQFVGVGFTLLALAGLAALWERA